VVTHVPLPSWFSLSRTAYRLRPLRHSPEWRRRGIGDTYRLASLHYLGSEGEIIVDVYASVPLFNEARRPRPASSVRTIMSKPVTPDKGGTRLSMCRASAHGWVYPCPL